MGGVVHPGYGNFFDGIKIPYSAAAANNNLPAGNSTLSLAATPENTFRTVTVVSLYYFGTITGVTLGGWASIGGVSVLFANVNPVISDHTYPFLVNITLGAGDYIFLSIASATLHDQAHIWAAGRDMSTI